MPRQGSVDRRGSPRAALKLECTLHRRTGSPISAWTVEVGPGGMSVASGRPLAPDEVLVFDLPPEGATPLSGHARVLRQQGHDVYALRFEHLQAHVREVLARLAAAHAG
jgi:PilZ domain